MKLWRSFHFLRSLWAQFLLDKYYRGTHILFIEIYLSGSSVCKRLKLVDRTTYYVVSWSRSWGIRWLLQTLTPCTEEQIGAVSLCVALNQIVWRDIPDVNFATKSAWQLVRSRRRIRDSYRLMWKLSYLLKYHSFVGDCGMIWFRLMWLSRGR